MQVTLNSLWSFTRIVKPMRGLRFNRLTSRVLVMMASLLALWLRLYMVEHVKLWPDELYEATQHIGQPFLHNIQYYQVDGQLLHVLAGQFMAQFGWDPLLLRWPSVIAGVLAIPLLYVLGNRFFDNRVCTLAAIILSFTHVHIDLSWQIRGYTLMLIFIVIGLYCLKRGFDTPRYWWWIGASVALGLAAHTHIFALLVLPPIFLFVIVRIGFYKVRSSQDAEYKLIIRQALLAMVILVLILFAIILLVVQHQTNVTNLVGILDARWKNDFVPFNLRDLSSLFLSYLEFNYYYSPLKIGKWPAVLMVGLVTLGVVIAFRRIRFRWAALLLLFVMLLPLFTMTTLTTILGPWFYAFRRYFLYILPPYLLFASLGIWFIGDRVGHLTNRQAVGSRVRLLTVSLILVGLFVSVFGKIFDLTDMPQRPNQVGRYLHTHYTAPDIVMCVPQEKTRMLNGSRHFCTITLHFFSNMANKTFLFDEITQYRTLKTFLRPHQDCTGHYIYMPSPHINMTCESVGPDQGQEAAGIWVVLWRDKSPDSFEKTLSLETSAYPSVRIGPTEVVYVSGQPSLVDNLIEVAKIAVSRADTPQRVYLNAVSLANLYAAKGDFEQAVATLDQVETQTGLVQRLFEVPSMMHRINANFANQVMLLGYDLPSRRTRPGQGLPITLYWQALQPMTNEYLEFNHLLDSQLNQWGGYDRIPREEYSTFFWKPGEVVIDEYTVPVDVDAPDGVYTLDLGMYLPAEDEAVPLPLIQDGQPIDANSVTVSPIKVGGPPPGVVLSAQEVSFDIPFSAKFGEPPVISLNGYDLAQEDDALRLTLYWESLAQTPIDWTTFVHLRNKGGQTVAQKDGPVGNGRYPTSLWEVGEIVADEIVIPLTDLPDDDYRLFIGLYNFITGERLSVPNNPASEVLLVEDVLAKSSVSSSLRRLAASGDLATLAEVLDHSMVYIPAGEFTMGSDTAHEDERPERQVYLDAFELDRYEVTNVQYQRFLQASGEPAPQYWLDNTYPAGQADHPVVGVSWSQAKAYCEWAGKRLPTEAEWEKACRGLNGNTFPWGNAWDPQRANVGYAQAQNWPLRLDEGWALLQSTAPSPDAPHLQPVGSYPEGQSAYGVLDLTGNVSEWVADWYNWSGYWDMPSRNPIGTEPPWNHAIRGSGWFDRRGCENLIQDLSRCSSRSSSHSYDDSRLGFRCAR
jgi:sulfatase modifying factor 1